MSKLVFRPQSCPCKYTSIICNLCIRQTDRQTDRQHNSSTI